jgi:hypothetical protein
MSQRRFKALTSFGLPAAHGSRLARHHGIEVVFILDPELALGEAGRGFENDTPGVHYRGDSRIEQRRDFNSFASHYRRFVTYAPDGGENLAWREATGFGRAGAGRERRVHHVHSDRDVQVLGTIKRLAYCFLQDRVETQPLNLGHVMGVHAVLQHPAQ